MMEKAACLDTGKIKRAYARWEPVYDVVFGKLFDPGRRAAVAMANGGRGSVLEVGVGTGISLPHYADHLTVTGIDLSPEMLATARERVLRGRLNHVAALIEMDAQDIQLPPNSFDTVVAMYVMTVVPDPRKVMQECARLCRPGGSVIVINHFSAEAGLRRACERLAAPAAAWLGWRPDFPLATILGVPGLKLVSSHAVPPLGLMMLLRFVKLGEKSVE